MYQKAYKNFFSMPETLIFLCKGKKSNFWQFFAFIFLTFSASNSLAACSTYIGDAYINEVFGTNQDSFVEVVTLSDTMPSDFFSDHNWTLLSCLGNNDCNTFNLSDFTANGPYSNNYFFHVLSPVTDLQANNIKNLQMLLIDENGKPVDFLKIDSDKSTYTSIQGALDGAGCSLTSTSPPTSDNSDRHFYRSPDGTGGWETGSPGASLQNATDGEPNDPDSLPPSITLNHIRLYHDGSGLTCSPETITIHACANDACDELYNDQVTVNFTSPVSGWFVDPATFINGTATVSLQHTSPPGAITLDAVSTSPTATLPTRCFSGSTETCTLVFYDSGFVFDVPDHTADSTETVTIRAVRKDNDSQQCIPGFQNETKAVGFWFDYLDPNTGTLAVNIDGTAISDTSPGTSFDLAFDNNGESQFDLRYPDVGLMRLNARHDGSGDSAGLVMTGLDQFITKPAYFTLDIPGNPGTATDASGAVFLAAGVDFPITVSARNASGDITPNYGLEATPESVLLTSLLVEPAGGNLPDIDGAFGTFGEDCDGNPAAAGTACGLFNWPEVGIIQLRPSVLDGNYLGAGDVIGTTSDNVGRFIPDRFSVTATNGTLDDFCGGFSYTGQPIAYQDTPNYLLTAQAATGATTLNYTGAFMKLTTSGLTIDPISSDASRLGSDGVTLTALVRTVGAPSLTDNADGTVTYEFGDDTFTYTKNDNAKIGPYDSDIQLTLSAATDSDGVSANGLPVNATPDSVEIRFGRLSLNNTHGSELIDLSSPMFTEHYNDSGFYQSNSLDSCTSTDIATHYSFTPSTGLSSTPGPALPVFVTGESALTFTAPGAGNTGFVDVITSISTDLPWLLDDRDGDGDYDDEAEARVTFGIFEGSPRHIYFREVYD